MFATFVFFLILAQLFLTLHLHAHMLFSNPISLIKHYARLRRFGPMKRKAQNEAASRPAAIDLVDYHRGSYLSQYALEGTFSKVRELGLPAAGSRKSQWRARKSTQAKRRHTGAASSMLICLCGLAPSRSPLSTPLRCSAALSMNAKSFAMF